MLTEVDETTLFSCQFVSCGDYPLTEEILAYLSSWPRLGQFQTVSSQMTEFWKCEELVLVDSLSISQYPEYFCVKYEGGFCMGLSPPTYRFWCILPSKRTHLKAIKNQDFFYKCHLSHVAFNFYTATNFVTTTHVGYILFLDQFWIRNWSISDTQ